MAQISEDERWMTLALRLGQRALGTTAENPAVGCVIVKSNQLISAGWTQPGGRPHAETHALFAAGERARAATAYVTLEPCSHHGKTPPCADALIAAGVVRVVTAVIDPNPKVSGNGLRKLQAAGVSVTSGVLEKRAARSHAGFFNRITRNRPYVTLKLAVSNDAKIAAAVGERTTITGEEVRRRVHLMRAQSDAILVGMGTALADDPELTVRLAGMQDRSPKPYVMGHRNLPAGLKLAKRNAEVVTNIAEIDANRLMVEGGAKTARSLIEAGLVDEFHLFAAPMTIGPKGVDALAGLPLAAALSAFHQTHAETLGNDRLTVYVSNHVYRHYY